jgi:hypothetical protein
MAVADRLKAGGTRLDTSQMSLINEFGIEQMSPQGIVIGGGRENNTLLCDEYPTANVISAHRNGAPLPGSGKKAQDLV